MPKRVTDLKVVESAVEAPQPSVTQSQVVAAVTNDPASAEVVFDLGGRKFPILDLGYDDYLLFLTKLQPLLGALAGQVTAFQGLVPTTSIDPGQLIAYCAEDLPYLACIVCKQTDPDITIGEVKKLGGNPFKLASLVLKQVEKNRFVSEIADFFVQILPLLRMGKRAVESQ